ncbi:MAG: leucyl/phenylalanyl-tRNA--protein transferase [Rhodoferax sp.]
MQTVAKPLALTWLEPGQDFVPVEQAWGPESDAPGLLCAGADLQPTTLIAAYRRGIFPWFGANQPILWWSPDPRMVLDVAHFKCHPSLRKRLRQFRKRPAHEIRIDSAFDAVIRACAQTPRSGQVGTWIVSSMVEAYQRLHAMGVAHSVETWIDNRLVGGLYCVVLGRMVFGESMFHRTTDASKIALAALVCMARHSGVSWIDCQQNTRHLASLGAAEVPRSAFLAHLARTVDQASAPLAWSNDLWQWLLL